MYQYLVDKSDCVHRRPFPGVEMFVHEGVYMTVSVVWGSTFLAIAYAIESFTPFGLSAARFVPAGLLALAIGRLRGERLPARRELPHLAAVGVLLLTVCMALIGWRKAGSRAA